MQIGRHQPHRIGVDQHAGAQALLEQPQQVQPVRQKRLFLDDAQTAMHLHIARFQLFLAPEQALQQRLGFDMHRLQFGQENPRQIAHKGGMAEIILHEQLDRAPPGHIDIAHARGHLDLQIKRQQLIGTFGGQMQMTAHRPQEIMRRRKGVIFLFGKQARLHQFGHIVDPVEILGDPEQRLQIAKPAFAFLDVGLHHCSADCPA